MNSQYLALTKRRKVLPLRVTLFLFRLFFRRKPLNPCADVPYWLSLVTGASIGIILTILFLINYSFTLPPWSLRAIGAFTLIIVIQLLASEAVNRLVIHYLSEIISPPIEEEDVWRDIDASPRNQVLLPLGGMLIALPLVIRYSHHLFPEIELGYSFIISVALVTLNTLYGMYMHMTSSVALARLLPVFATRLYEFFPTGSPIVRHLANLFSTALLITILTSIATVSVSLFAFPSPLMFKIAVIALLSFVGMSICAFLFHLASISEMIELGKQKTLKDIQDRIAKIKESGSLSASKGALEEIGKLIEISEKISNAKPRILSINISLKYLIATISPLLTLSNKDYLPALQKILDSIKDVL